MGEDPATTAVESADDGVAIPRRWRWTRWIVLINAALLVTVPIVRGVAGRVADRRLAAAVAAIEADGGTLDWDRLRPPPVDPADNAAPLYTEAAAKVDVTALKQFKIACSVCRCFWYGNLLDGFAGSGGRGLRCGRVDA